jgi:hypothetical protein
MVDSVLREVTLEAFATRWRFVGLPRFAGIVAYNHAAYREVL